MQVRQTLQAYCNQPSRVDEVGVRAKRGESFRYDEPTGQAPKKQSKPEGVGRAVNVELSLAGRIKCVAARYNPARLGKAEAMMLTEELSQLGLSRKDVKELVDPLVHSFAARTEALRLARRQPVIQEDDEAAGQASQQRSAQSQQSIASWASLARHFDSQVKAAAQTGKSDEVPRRLSALARLLQ